MTTALPGAWDVAVLRRRVRREVAATIYCNVIEAVVAITTGSIASSAALVGFGLDSVSRSLSGCGCLAVRQR